MPPEPDDTQQNDPGPPGPNPALYTHEGEVRALRSALARLETLMEQTDDPVALMRLAAAIARLSDSIVRATAAHHKLALLAEKSKLKEEWAKLEEARGEQELDEAQRRRDRAVYFRGDQVHWLNRLSEVTRQAVDGNYMTMNEFAASLDAYIKAGNFAYPPDRFTLARLGYAVPAGDQGNNSQDAVVTNTSNRSERDPVVQLK